MKKFGSAKDWLSFGVGAVAIGITLSLSKVVILGVGLGVITLGVVVCALGLLVWRSNIRTDEHARAVGATPAEPRPGGPEAARPIRPALTEYYANTAKDNPLSAIILAYLAIEGWYDHEFEERGLDHHDGTRKRTVREMSRLAVEVGFLPASTVPTIDGLGVMRDLAIDRGAASASTAEAEHYLLLAEGALLSLDNLVGDFE